MQNPFLHSNPVEPHEESLDEIMFEIAKSHAIASNLTPWYQHVANGLSSLFTWLVSKLPKRTNEWQQLADEMDDEVFYTISKDRRKNHRMRHLYDQAKAQVRYRMLPKTLLIERDEDIA